MSAAHTPGPWVAHIVKTEGARIQQAPTEGAKSVAWVGADDTAEVGGRIVERMTGEAQSNANLIAAAPELLAVAESVVLRGHSTGCATVSSIDRPGARKVACDCLYRLAETALAKARGGGK